MTLYETVPLPLPLAPLVTVIHAALLAAVQAQPASVVTVTVPVVATDVLSNTDEGRMVYVHGAPGCVIVNVLPPIVSVPLRDVVLVFCVTLYVTLPFPVPLAPTPIVIHASLLVAVHPQPVPAVTVINPLAANEDGRFDEVGEIATVHWARASGTTAAALVASVAWRSSECVNSTRLASVVGRADTAGVMISRSSSASSPHCRLANFCDSMAPRGYRVSEAACMIGADAGAAAVTC